MLFLLIQLVLAVILLHIASFLSPKVEIPQLTCQTAKKLTPVTLVNVIGLVFNILCLRGVEASFFQVSSAPLPFLRRFANFDPNRLPGGWSYL